MKPFIPGVNVRFVLQTRRAGVMGAQWSSYSDHWFTAREAAVAEAAALSSKHQEFRVLRITTTVEELTEKENA